MCASVRMCEFVCMHPHVCIRVCVCVGVVSSVVSVPCITVYRVSWVWPPPQHNPYPLAPQAPLAAML